MIWVFLFAAWLVFAPLCVRSRKRHVRRDDAFPPPYPKGWIPVAGAHEIPCVVTALGRELQIDRDGAVAGERSVRADGLIFVWHGEGEPWALDDATEEPGRLDAYWRLSLAAHPQDLTENQTDFAHAGALHRHLLPGVTFEVSPDEHAESPNKRLGFVWRDRDRWVPRVGVDAGDVAHEMTAVFVARLLVLGLLRVRAFVVIRQVGPCLLKIRVMPWMFGRYVRVPVTVQMAATPRGPLDLDVRVLGFTERRWLPAIVAKAILGFFAVVGRQDFTIWNTKTYKSRPVLVAADAQIVRFRRWYAQFYARES